MKMLRSAVLGSAAAVFRSQATAANAAADKITWKPLDQAILSVDGKAPQFWNVYTGDKQNQLLLVQLWKRYLLVDRKQEVVYDIDPKTLAKKGDDLELPLAAKPEKPLALSEL